MTARFESAGNHVMIVFSDGERQLRARCANEADARKAAGMLQRARDLNDRQRKYTAAARLIAACDGMDGFVWATE